MILEDDMPSMLKLIASWSQKPLGTYETDQYQGLDGESFRSEMNIRVKQEVARRQEAQEKQIDSERPKKKQKQLDSKKPEKKQRDSKDSERNATPKLRSQVSASAVLDAR